MSEIRPNYGHFNYCNQNTQNNNNNNNNNRRVKIQPQLIIEEIKQTNNNHQNQTNHFSNNVKQHSQISNNTVTKVKQLLFCFIFIFFFYFFFV